MSCWLLTGLIGEAIRPVVLGELRCRREAFATDWHRERAARTEAAAAEWPDEARLVTVGGARRALTPSTLGVGSGCEEQLRIWVLRALDHLVARSALHHLAGVHHQHLVGEV